MPSLEKGDIVEMRTGHHARCEVVQAADDGALLIFLDDIAFAKQHGLPRNKFEMWFPSQAFEKVGGTQ